ncbi:hypothetical protein O9992_25510 [Vibrio lentus]|nr:hypothetical protein [Vibrio lentus]
MYCHDWYHLHTERVWKAVGHVDRTTTETDRYGLVYSSLSLVCLAHWWLMLTAHL